MEWGLALSGDSGTSTTTEEWETMMSRLQNPLGDIWAGRTKPKSCIAATRQTNIKICWCSSAASIIRGYFRGLGMLITFRPSEVTHKSTWSLDRGLCLILLSLLALHYE